jgi:carboxymethylenebutenolidase
MGIDQKISVPDGAFEAYVAAPALAKAPGLILIQYISGVNRVMRTLADGFARAGFLVACPDLFWRQEPNVRINNDPASPDPKEQKRALELNAGFVDETGMADLAATLAFLRALPGCTGKVGALGYCLGGRMAFLMAARTDVDCAVGYYGVNLQRYLDEVNRIRRPLLLHVAENDELCPVEIRDRILTTLKSVPSVSVEVHPGTRHAFALEGGANFDAGAAQRANRQSMAYLHRNLTN